MPDLGRWIVVISVASIACGDQVAPTADADESVRIIVPATSTDFETFFTIFASGVGTDAVQELELSRHAGSVSVFGSRLDALAYYYAWWPAHAVDAFQTLIVAPDRWYVAWLYCDGDQITKVYLEGTDGTPLDSETATGGCVHSNQRIAERVELPAINMAYPVLEAGYTFSGEDITYDGVSPGTVRFDGVEMLLLPFEDVDCTGGCGSGTGWRELHALLYDPAQQRACFGMFFMQEPGRVDLAYSICLPDLAAPLGTRSFSATWQVL